MTIRIGSTTATSPRHTRTVISHGQSTPAASPTTTTTAATPSWTRRAAYRCRIPWDSATCRTPRPPSSVTSLRRSVLLHGRRNWTVRTCFVVRSTAHSAAGSSPSHVAYDQPGSLPSPRSMKRVSASILGENLHARDRVAIEGVLVPVVACLPKAPEERQGVDKRDLARNLERGGYGEERMRRATASPNRAGALRVSAWLGRLKAPRVGLEPTTLRLTAECSAN